MTQTAAALLSLMSMIEPSDVSDFDSPTEQLAHIADLLVVPAEVRDLAHDLVCAWSNADDDGWVPEWAAPTQHKLLACLEAGLLTEAPDRADGFILVVVARVGGAA